MSIQKKTKIVATLGPATEDREVLRKMIEAGVDVFRVNFSHADYEDVAHKGKGHPIHVLRNCKNGILNVLFG